MMFEVGNSTPLCGRSVRSSSVVPALLTLLAIGVVAPDPVHGQYNTYHCKRVDGGSINGTTIDQVNDTVIVAPGERLTGHIAVEAYFWIHWEAKVALGGTVTWEPRDEQYWQYLSDIATASGAQTKRFYVPVNRVAPLEPGTYYIIIAYARDHISRIFSCSGGLDPAPVDDWHDGNDVGFDWTPEQFQGALNDGILQVRRKTGGAYYLEDMAAAAVRVVVACTPDDPCCGDGVCVGGESPCNCRADCGDPVPEICDNGRDDDCDGLPDAVDPDCICLVSTIAEGHPTAHETLELIRRFRDNELASTESGRAIIRQYYVHAGEVLSIVLQNPDLRARVSAAFWDNLPSLEVAMNGGDASVSAETIGTLDDLLGDLQRHAGAALGDAIDDFRRELNSAEFLQQFGFTLAGGSGSGACCIGDSCLTTDSIVCAASRGEYQGDGTNCGDAPCRGACCFGESCSPELDLLYCARVGGSFQGPGTSCSDLQIDCPPTTGPCCDEAGGCYEATPTACAESGGTIGRLGVRCSEICCESMLNKGACCLDDGTCTPLCADRCAAAGGTYNGDGSACDELLCQGACCSHEYTYCYHASEAVCTAFGDSFHGTGVSCDEVECPTGACCFPWGSCGEAVEAECVGEGGTFRGLDVRCDDVECEGACCDPQQGQCYSAYGENQCATINGTFFGYGSSCQDTGVSCPSGACCVPHSGECFRSGEGSCTDGGGIFHGLGSLCLSVDCPVGACCFEDAGYCSETGEGLCEEEGGIFGGLGSRCEDLPCVGACCNDYHGCIHTGEGFCVNDLGGTFHGRGSECDDAGCPLGACCMSEGYCTETGGGNCVDEGGVFAGVGSTCDERVCSGACCDVNFGGCYVAERWSCYGDFQGPGTTCGDSTIPCPGPHGACCLGDGDCRMAVAALCDQKGGTYRGDGSTCDSDACSGACCVFGEACIDSWVNEESCRLGYGGVYQGLGTLCTDESIACTVAVGACCATGDAPVDGGGGGLAEESSDCTDGMTELECKLPGAGVGAYLGDGSTCDDTDCPDPTPNCPSDGDCCEPHRSGGCDDATCCQRVCAEDPYCCLADVWDEICARLADSVCGNATGSYCPCPLEEIISASPDGANELSTLRAFRDQVLTRTPDGERYIALYYNHAAEATRLILLNGELRRDARAVLLDISPLIRRSLDGEQATIRPALVAKIQGVLRKMRRVASPEFAAELDSLYEQLAEGKLRSLAGMAVERRPARR